jgi:hypothetical protein
MLGNVEHALEDGIGEAVDHAGPRSHDVYQANEGRRLFEVRERIGERSADLATLGVGCAKLRRAGERCACDEERDADDGAARFARDRRLIRFATASRFGDLAVVA